MSADRWTVCPRCEAARDAAAKRYADEAAAATSLAEFGGLNKKAQGFKAAPMPDTLREDYEVGIIKGVFSVSYHAECDCGFKHVFRMNNTNIK